MAKRASFFTAKATPKATAPAAPAFAAKPVAAKAPKAVVTSEMIARKAYEIWERKGKPVGQDLENWQQAERELGVR